MVEGSLRQLRELVQARRSLARDRTALQNRMQDLSLPLLRRQATAGLPDQQ